MVEIQGTLYPLTTIKFIRIDRENLTLTVNFMEGLKLFPLVLKYNSLKELEKKVGELSGTKRSLLG